MICNAFIGLARDIYLEGAIFPTFFDIMITTSLELNAKFRPARVQRAHKLKTNYLSRESCWL